MTGTEATGKEESPQGGLARSLFRVPLPRWRGTRYSLSKLFFNFYLLAMGSFVAIAFTADFVISTAQRGITDDYARRFMRGTITLIEDELFRHPRSSWHKQIEQINEKFSYHLDIVELLATLGVQHPAHDDLGLAVASQIPRRDVDYVVG